MKLYHKLTFILFPVVCLLFILYSFALIDLNITLFNHPLWEQAREKIIWLGYYQRTFSSAIYIAFIVIFFLFNLFFANNHKFVSFKYIAIVLFFVSVLSYPFLSHDFFNYLFDAKIFTFYHKNPYFYTALDFPNDKWLRFLQWTHRSYPYGPVFLIFSTVPSFLAFGKLILNIIFFKLAFFIVFLWSFKVLHGMNARLGIIYATHPLILVEGLVNSHNDILALSLAIVGIYYLRTNHRIKSRALFILSAGVKYITAPFVFLQKNTNHKINLAVLTALVVILSYLSFWQEVQPWYFIALFGLLPYFETLILKFNVFFMGLLFSYYPYVRFGGWSDAWQVTIKHQIILFFFILNLAYIFSLFLRKSKK